MGTGIILSIIVIGGLTYLIPWYASSAGSVENDDDQDSFADSMTLIRRAGALVDPNADECEVSTPMTRRAAMHDVQQAHRSAAVRRRRVVLFLLVMTVVAALLPLVNQVLPARLPQAPWWGAAIPGGTLLVFLAIARYSVVSLNEALDRRVETIQSGWEDDTISFVVPDELREDRSTELSVELSEPITGAGSWWDPIPVTTPTYVSKPLVPRTVRTIDLSALGPVPDRTPVTNDTQELPRADVDAADDAAEGDRKRAVGE